LSELLGGAFRFRDKLDLSTLLFPSTFNSSTERSLSSNKDKPLVLFVKEDYILWAKGNKQAWECDQSATLAWLKLESLRNKTVREASTFDMEKAKLARLKTKSRFGGYVTPQTVATELMIWSAFFVKLLHGSMQNPTR
jgi:hypothetical protein